MRKVIFKIVVCFLLTLGYLPGYAQQPNGRPASRDTISSLNQQQREKELFEKYVTLVTNSPLNKKDSKVDIMVLPVMGIHPSQLSYGVMVGAVKRTGGYVKFRHSFSNASSDGAECNDEGVDIETEDKRWYSGRTEKSRMAVTAGVMHRLWTPFYLYAGVGYGTRKLSWETIGGEWLQNSDHSYRGLEAEIGGLLRFGAFAVSVGVQTNSFKYAEANVGIGVAF